MPESVPSRNPPAALARKQRERRSTLTSRNIRIGRHRTSVRLEPVFWDILERISTDEKMSVHDICSAVSERAAHLPLTGALRVFLISYAWHTKMHSALETVEKGRMDW